MNDLFADFHYWMFVVFLQFVPLNETDIGHRYHYTTNDETGRMVIQAKEVNFENPDDLRWEFSAHIENSLFYADTFSTVIRHTPKDGLFFEQFSDNGFELISDTGSVSIPDITQGLLISVEDNKQLIPTKTKSKAKIKLDDEKFVCQKTIFTGDHHVITVYYDEMFGLLKAEYYSELQNNRYSFVRVKSKK
jgi:hypothetical protein